MSKLKKTQAAAKRAAYKEKQDQQGRKQMNIFMGILIALAVAYLAYSIYMMS